MKRVKFLATLFFLFLFQRVYSQQASIQGIITEGGDGEEQPVPFANVVIKGTSRGTTTDFGGRYRMDVEPGTHELIISYVGYETDTLKNVNVAAGEHKVINHNMSSSAVNIEEFEVVERANRENGNMLLMDRKEADQLVQNIGAEELSKKGVSDVASGLKKVVGLSLVGTKYVFVRGMGDRYNSAYLNGMPLPSPDPDRKVIPLNIFPTNIVRNINVVKAFTPELYGDFSGGAIDIVTKDYPDEPTLKVSVGASGNSNVTFQDFKTYSGGSSDYWGRDDGTREIPEKVLQYDRYDSRNNGEIMAFESNFNPRQVKAPVNNSFSIFGGDFYTIGNRSGIGFTASLSYDNSYSYQKEEMKVVNAQNDLQLDYDVENYGFNTNSSALLSTVLKLNEQHKLNYTFLFANLSSDKFRDTYGEHFDYNKNVFSRRYTYRENNLAAHQLRGEHKFLENDRIKINWGASQSQAQNTEPDRRQLIYLYGEGMSETNYTINAKDRIDNHRFFSELNEEETSATLSSTINLKYKASSDGEKKPVLSVGLGADYKDKLRNFDYRQFIYDLSDLNNLYPDGVNINNPDAYLSQENHNKGLFYIDEVTGPEAMHAATLKVMGGYVNTAFEVIPGKLKAMAGARLEKSEQAIYYKKQQDSYYKPRRAEAIDTMNILPSLALKYTASETSLYRFSASKTLSRPGFREMAPFEYTEVFAGTKNIGNPRLKNGENYNADLRYEAFPRPGELFAVAVFGKYLLNPIEKTFVATASGRLQTFQNTQSAYVGGVELEFSKNLGFFDADSSILDNMSVGLNATYLYSQINIDTNTVGGASVVVTNAERSLQGASPYIVNFDLSYEKWWNENVKTFATVVYNVFGRRLYAAGILGIGDAYELPVNTLDLIVKAEINRKWGIKLSAKNLLNPTYRIEQETDGRPILINSYKRGVGVGLSMSYNIF